MNRFIRVSLAALIGFAAPLQAFGWGTVTGPKGGTATTGPRGAGNAQGPNGATAARGPRGAGYAQGPNGAAAMRARGGGAAADGPNGGTAYRRARFWPAWLSRACLWRSGICRRRLQAMGRGTLLRCRRRGRGDWHRNRCHDATTPTVTSLVLVLVESSVQPGVLGLLCPIGDEIPKRRRSSMRTRRMRWFAVGCIRRSLSILSSLPPTCSVTLEDMLAPLPCPAVGPAWATETRRAVIGKVSQRTTNGQ